MVQTTVASGVNDHMQILNSNRKYVDKIFGACDRTAYAAKFESEQSSNMTLRHGKVVKNYKFKKIIKDMDFFYYNRFIYRLL